MLTVEAYQNGERKKIEQYRKLYSQAHSKSPNWAIAQNEFQFI